MPNWCNNSITLKHRDPAMIERAVKAYQEGRLLQEFIPVPEDLLREGAATHGGPNGADYDAIRAENIEKHGYPSWYEYCVSQWGTKWDVGGNGEFIEQPNANTLEASFESAWSPPTTAYEKLAALGFEIEAYYWEPGMAFCGKWTGDEDDYFDDYYEYGGETSETVRALIGDDLDERFCISEMMADWEAENAED